MPTATRFITRIQDCDDYADALEFKEVGYTSRAPVVLVTFMFDDGDDTAYSVMKPVFDAQGEVACVAIPSDNVGGGSKLTAANLVTMEAAGWEILSHGETHTDLTGMSAAEADAELLASRTALRALGLTINNLVYPFNASNADVRRSARSYYRSAAGQVGQNEQVLEQHRWYRYNADDHTELATFQGYVDTAESDLLWLVFNLHATDSDDATAIGTLIDYIQAKSISIVTVDQALDLIGNVVSVGDNFAVSEAGLRASYVQGPLVINSGALQFTNANVQISRVSPNSLRLDAYSGWDFYSTQGSANRLSISEAGDIEMLHNTFVGVGAGKVNLLFDDSNNVIDVRNGALRLIADEQKLYFGATQNLHIQFDGDDAVFTVTSGQFRFVGGNVELEDTTDANAGVITKGADRFIHNFHHPTGGGAVPIGENTFVGVDAGNFTMTAVVGTYQGSKNVGVGVGALNALTTGYNNVAIGIGSLGATTTGHNNLALGADALDALTTGARNMGVGAHALGSATGSNNTAVGYISLGNIVAGLGNVGAGYGAGRYIADGSTPNQTTDYSVYVGYETKASADGADNEIVIGYGAIGKGANTAVIGGSTLTKLYVPSLDVDGGFAANLVTKTANYTATTSDHVILCDASGGAFTITLPVASGIAGIVYHIKKTDSSASAVTVDGNGAEKIDGDLTIDLALQYESVMIVCDGSNWHII